MDQTEFSRRFKNSPVKGTKQRGLLRNVAVSLGNWGLPEAIPVLVEALPDHEALVRGHAAWALGRIGRETAQAARFAEEDDEWVREESHALGGEAAQASPTRSSSFETAGVEPR